MVWIGARRSGNGDQRWRDDRCDRLTQHPRGSVRKDASQLNSVLMDIDLADLPDNVETLQRMVRSLASERASLTEAQAEIERLHLKKLQRS
jgi:hypothetical protein